MSLSHPPESLPGPLGPEPGMDEGPPARPVPGLGTFLRSRFISANGVASILYLLLSLWIFVNPRKAARLWRRLQGH